MPKFAVTIKVSVPRSGTSTASTTVTIAGDIILAESAMVLDVLDQFIDDQAIVRADILSVHAFTLDGAA